MEPFAHITFWAWVMVSLLQVLFVGIWLKSIRPKPSQPEPPNFHPKTLVLMAIRGADPRLVQCLHGILDQDYPNYELGIIVDSQEDPAWELVQKVLRTVTPKPSVHVSPLKNRLVTAGLKNSSLLQVLEELDPSFETIAMLDSDLVPPRYWLRKLVSPFADPRVGATTASQWFLPVGSKWGTWVRYLLGIVAMVIMAAFNIPWGGTFAFRVKILRETPVLDWLRHSLPDTPIFHRGIQQLGLELQRVPNLLMTHHEECSVKAATQWYARMLLWVRYYNSTWTGVVAVAILPVLLFYGTIAALALVLLNGQRDLALWVLGGPFVYLITSIGLVRWIEANISNKLESLLQPEAHGLKWRLLPAVFLTMLANSFALAWASFAKKVAWRGIVYSIEGPYQVRKLSESNQRLGELQSASE